MRPSPVVRLRIVAWVVTFLLPVAAWRLTGATLPWLHPGVGVFFVLAAAISAALGGMRTAIVAALLNVVALNAYSYLHRSPVPHIADALWSALVVTLVLVIGQTREKWSAAEMLAGHLSLDLAHLRDELDSQRSDLKRFHELSVSLSSSLELQRLLNDVLTAIASLQKTDLAMLLLLPDAYSKSLRVETYAGFTPEQIKLFGELRVSFFSTHRRTVVEDVESPGVYFPFGEAAKQVGFCALFSAPIITGKGEPLGVVVTFFREPHFPPERRCKLVELYARQAANALENARLYRNSLDTLAAEQHRTAVLRSLAEASVQINSAVNVDSLLEVITGQARRIIGAQQAFTTLLPRDDRTHSITCTAAADGQAALQFPPERSEIFLLACSLNKPVRITTRTAQDHPWWNIINSQETARVGWLAAPLVTRDGRNLGLIQLSRKVNGEFTEDDEAILVQLAHMASVALDNVHLYREAQDRIAQNHKTQEQLQRSKESMDLAQRCVGIGIWEWDLQSGELAWSDEICRLHGFEPKSFDGKYESWMQNIQPENRPEVHRALSGALAKAGEYQVEYRVLLSDKSVRWLEARGQTIAMGNTPVRMLGVAMDVTSRKLGEEALRRSEKAAATGRLAASIAHEINNPLAAVTNALYILRTQPQLPAQALEYVLTAESELARVAHITRQTLAFYREVSAPVPTSIPHLLDEVLGAFSHKLEEKNIAVRKKYASVEQLRAFPNELRQVFSNLILNALEATSTSGTLFIRVRQTVAQNGRRGLRITVADNGSGIVPENVSRIFEPFFTTKEAKGNGLGLWVSQGIVQKHQGSIRVRSRSGPERHGACFAVFLPFEISGVGDAAEIQPAESFPTPNSSSIATAASSGSDLSVA
jgi:PAS domain S-box-containing protein